MRNTTCPYNKLVLLAHSVVVKKKQANVVAISSSKTNSQWYVVVGACMAILRAHAGSVRGLGSGVRLRCLRGLLLFSCIIILAYYYYY
jgi:hypothetical protein